MSKEAQHHQPKSEHGTMTSYIIGFILSLIFTAIPYYLVTHQSLSGTALRTTIIGIAFVQMLIQIFFFLHLGRGPKPLYNVVFYVFTVGMIAVVIGGSIFIMNHLHYNMAPSEVAKNRAESEGIYQLEGQKTGACQQIFENHQITIKDGQMTPVHTEARLCDTLTFINEDTQTHEITFATGTYSGQDKLSIPKTRPKTITLNQTGTYPLHHNLAQTSSGDFTVTP